MITEPVRDMSSTESRHQAKQFACYYLNGAETVLLRRRECEQGGFLPPCREKQTHSKPSGRSHGGQDNSSAAVKAEVHPP